MAGELKGFIACPLCKDRSPVRANKNAKLFCNCGRCGIIYPNTAEGQAYIHKHMELVTDEAPPKKEPEPLATSPKKTPQKVEPPKSSGKVTDFV